MTVEPLCLSKEKDRSSNQIQKISPVFRNRSNATQWLQQQKSTSNLTLKNCCAVFLLFYHYNPPFQHRSLPTFNQLSLALFQGFGSIRHHSLLLNLNPSLFLLCPVHPIHLGSQMRMTLCKKVTLRVRTKKDFLNGAVIIRTRAHPVGFLLFMNFSN